MGTRLGQARSLRGWEAASHLTGACAPGGAAESDRCLPLQVSIKVPEILWQLHPLVRGVRVRVWLAKSSDLATLSGPQFPPP